MTENQPRLFPPNGNKPRAIVYVDGFNLYNGSIKGTSHKWLDLQKYFDLLRQHDEVVKVHYFTAVMHGNPGSRQQVYLDALDTLDRVNVIVGRYKRKRVECRVRACGFSGERRFPTWEEKRTDVSIAIQMVDDAYQNACDTLVVVSGDSDLVPAIHTVKNRFPEKTIVVYVPARDSSRGAATEMRGASDRNATLPMALLGKCHFPAEIRDGVGGTIQKPDSW